MTQHERLIEAGAPALPADHLYEVTVNPIGRAYTLTVDVYKTDGNLHTGLLASQGTQLSDPMVEDAVDLAKLAASIAVPGINLRPDLRQLVYGAAE